jgi:hypothetical protein
MLIQDEHNDASREDEQTGIPQAEVGEPTQQAQRKEPYVRNKISNCGLCVHVSKVAQYSLKKKSKYFNRSTKNEHWVSRAYLCACQRHFQIAVTPPLFLPRELTRRTLLKRFILCPPSGLDDHSKLIYMTTTPMHDTLLRYQSH